MSYGFQFSRPSSLFSSLSAVSLSLSLSSLSLSLSLVSRIALIFMDGAVISSSFAFLFFKILKHGRQNASFLDGLGCFYEITL